MGVTQLTEREQLIERILKMPEEKVAAITKFLQELEDVEKAEDAEDLATLDARKNEIGIPLDDALSELGYTREELMQKARDEGLVWTHGPMVRSKCKAKRPTEFDWATTALSTRLRTKS